MISPTWPLEQISDFNTTQSCWRGMSLSQSKRSHTHHILCYPHTCWITRELLERGVCMHNDTRVETARAFEPSCLHCMGIVCVLGQASHGIGAPSMRARRCPSHCKPLPIMDTKWPSDRALSAKRPSFVGRRDGATRQASCTERRVKLLSKSAIERTINRANYKSALLGEPICRSTCQPNYWF